jgi:hypothetical protein
MFAGLCTRMAGSADSPHHELLLTLFLPALNGRANLGPLLHERRAARLSFSNAVMSIVPVPVSAWIDQTTFYPTGQAWLHRRLPDSFISSVSCDCG